MYIKLIDNEKDLVITNHTLARKSVERLSLESSAKWLRDNTGKLHIAKFQDKYSIVIECSDITAPFIDVSYIGKLFEINCKTRMTTYCSQDERLQRTYQDGSLAYHSSESEKSISTFDNVEKVTQEGMYSYKPIIRAYLQSVDIVRDDQHTAWKLRFEEQ